jgi:hypothetical protein
MTTEDYPEEELAAEQAGAPAEDVEVLEDEDVVNSDEAESPAEQAEEPSSDARPEEQLLAIIDQAKSSRLAPADEDHAVQLLKQAVAGGPKALPAAIEAILSLPWNASVKAVVEAWPETKPAGRTRLLTGLAKTDSDTSRRIRLSLARGLHAQDPAGALKLLSGVCEAMGGAQGGSTTKDRQIFANVMLGKARPWIMNIAMAEMKAADAQKLIIPALESCHQAPIFTQIWVLRWVCEADKFDTLTTEHVESIGKSINRWQGRWHKELRKIIPKLPDSLEAALAAAAGGRGHAAVHAAAPAEAPAPSEAPETAEEPAEGADEVLLDATPEETRPPAPQPVRAERELRASPRERGGSGGGPFDLTRSLRDIEAYVVRLRSDLQQAQLAARRGAPERQRAGRTQQAGTSTEEFEELRRHNHQLEEQNQELRQRIEELTTDHEDRAATLNINDALEQFKTYLGLKLKEDFADYTAISREALNEVVRRHAHEILGRIFTVLQAEGVRFEQEE